MPLRRRSGAQHRRHRYRKTAEKEIRAFQENRERAQDHFDDQLKEVMNGKLLCVAFEPLEKDLELLNARLQRYITRHRLQRQLNKLLPVSTRTPAGHGKDKIVSDVQQWGMTLEMARRGVNAVFDIWKEALANHEIVETPVGDLIAALASAPRKKQAWGKEVTMFSQNRRIALKDRKNVDEIPPRLITPTKDSMTTPTSEPSSPAGASSSAGVTCLQCGGSHFMKAEFAHFQNSPSSGIGGGIQRLSGDAIQTWVCLCGYPLGPASPSRAQKELPDFHRSLEKARDYRNRQRQQPEMWAEQFVDSKTLEDYRNRLAAVDQKSAFVASEKASAKQKKLLTQKQKQTSSKAKK